jgi:hypothetical protein
MSTPTTTRENQSTKMFNRYKLALEHLREELMKKRVSEKSIKLTEFFGKEKVSLGTGKILRELGAMKTYKESSNKRDGAYMEWTYKGNGTGEVDTKLVQHVLDIERQQSQERNLRFRDKKVHGVAPVTSAVKSVVTLNPENINHQIEWLNNQLEKNIITPGYLRFGEEEVYPKIIENLESVLELEQLVLTIKDGINKFSGRFKKD